MKNLTEQQLRALEQISIIAETAVLGTLILGRFLAPGNFALMPFVIGAMIYLIILWITLQISRKRRG